MSRCDQSNPRSSEGTWEKLSQVAVKGAIYDSRERQPHPKCLEGTRVDLLNYIYELSDKQEKSQLIWLHGTAGVGKSAVAFTVAERMRGLKVTEETNIETRLAGTFFFSRKNTNRCTTGYLFATLAYQLASNFPSVREEVNRGVRENPALLDPDMSLRDQMNALFLRPLRRLHLRLRGCPPLSFVIDALDECTSEMELADLISLLAQVLREPGLPVLHILLTSRSEVHIRGAIQEEGMCLLVCEIPVKTSGEGVAAIISLDGADVDNDICIFLEHSFRKLRTRHSDFPQPTRDEIARLASRAGRRFIVASTMMKFIDDGYNDPRDRLQLMLELTSELLPGTEVYKLYDSILSTCANSNRAYLHLSVVAALANPLPISQISKLLGPGQGRDVETVLVQLRSIMDIPTDTSLPVNIYHSSVRDYVSDPSNCNLPQVKYTMPHSLLAYSSFRLMIQDIPGSMALLHALSELKKHCNIMRSHDPKNLTNSLAFIVQPPEPIQVLISLLWLREHRRSALQSWLGTLDGHAWLRTRGGNDWLWTLMGQSWLQTQGGMNWLQSKDVRSWLNTQGGRGWLQTHGGRDWLQTHGGQDWLQTYGGRDWVQTQDGRDWVQTRSGQAWLQTQGGRDWLQTHGGRCWMQTHGGRCWLQTHGGRDWLRTHGGRGWLETHGGQVWLRTHGGRGWLRMQDGRGWLETRGVQGWLQSQSGQDWQDWLLIGGWLQSQVGREWLESEGGRKWLETGAQDWLDTQSGRGWLYTQGGKHWLQIQSGREWLQSSGGQKWLQSSGGLEWLLGRGRGQEWLQTQSGHGWLQTQGGREWLPTHSGRSWLQTQDGKGWLQTQDMQGWLQAQGGQDWLQTQGGRDWLQTQSGQDWLQTPHGQAWPLMAVWVTMGDFSSTLEAISEYALIPQLPLLPAFQVIEHFKSLPDFLMFPAFLALRHQGHSTSTLPQSHLPPNMEIIRAMEAFTHFANETWERSQSVSDALKYACQNWAVHLSQSPNP